MDLTINITEEEAKRLQVKLEKYFARYKDGMMDEKPIKQYVKIPVKDVRDEMFTK